MDENLEYLLHDELEGLFAAPAAARARTGSRTRTGTGTQIGRASFRERV